MVFSISTAKYVTIICTMKSAIIAKGCQALGRVSSWVSLPAGSNTDCIAIKCAPGGPDVRVCEGRPARMWTWRSCTSCCYTFCPLGLVKVQRKPLKRRQWQKAYCHLGQTFSVRLNLPLVPAY